MLKNGILFLLIIRNNQTNEMLGIHQITLPLMVTRKNLF